MAQAICQPSPFPEKPRFALDAFQLNYNEGVLEYMPSLDHTQLHLYLRGKKIAEHETKTTFFIVSLALALAIPNEGLYLLTSLFLQTITQTRLNDMIASIFIKFCLFLLVACLHFNQAVK